MAERESSSGRSFDGAWYDRDTIDESATRSSDDGGAPVFSEIHVSCYVTAANRATPVLQVLPERNCVRVVNKSSGDNSSSILATSASMAGMMSTSLSSGASVGNSGLSAEWEFHSVFPSNSLSHAADFFNEITLPALRSACDGINTNVVVWGVHPTQKFRLLFGKSVGAGGGPFVPQSEFAMNDIVEMHGQLAGMFHAFFTQPSIRSGGARASPWRLGISSWIIVNNQAFDLLQTPTGSSLGDSLKASSTSSTDTPISFVSLEASSLESALRIMQQAKTNRIVRKHNAESAHFFVRLALFRGGQVSTVHLVDLIDQKDFLDHISMQEKLEFYSILHGLRQPLSSPRRNSKPFVIPVSGGSGTTTTPGKMVLSNFMLPILTANAKTFLYANVIDSRTSLRESVQMLNAVANLRGFTCACKRLRGVSFEQLNFQASPNDLDLLSYTGEPVHQVTTEAQREVNNACMPNPLSSSTPLSEFRAANLAVSCKSLDSPLLSRLQPAPVLSNAATEPDAMSWLSAFAQRKRDILGGSIDTIPAIRPSENMTADTSLVSTTESEECQQSNAIPEARPSITDFYDRLRESLEDVSALAPTQTVSPRTSYCSVHCLSPSRSILDKHQPLPIVDQDGGHEDFAQVGRNSNADATCGRPQPQHSQQQQVDELPAWASINRPVDCSPPRYRETWGTQAPGSRPESDAAGFPEMAASPLSLASPSTLPLIPSLTNIHTLKAFKKVGLPASMMSPPNVEGLDVKTAQKVQAADATLLRKNYEALLSIVREQQQAKEAAEARATEAMHDQEELRAMFEVQIENMKLANVALRSKVRALESHTSLPRVFEQYEQELRTLHSQVQQLQERNVALELRTNSADGGSGSMGGSNGSSNDIKKKYQQVVEEKLALEREVQEFRRKERHLQAHSRLAGESTRRVDQLSRELNNKAEDLVAARLGKQRLSAEMNQALEKSEELHMENEKLLQEKAATTEELLATRMYLASLENEKKKASVLDRFVEKHGDRMNKLRQHDSSSGTRGESWRRDQYARECEDKLLASVKRSLPQAVPLCNKLLRRLEMQELSLREFSEREVDFINMLVELVSDQPTVSLKQMIEQEMKKLQSC